MNSWKKPTPQQIEKAIALLIPPQQRLYFFNHLNNPLWIEPLKEKGFFENPPQVIRNSEEGTVSFPRWAESRYLARMAEQNPNAVLEIALQIKTENPRVHEDFVEAALQMPPEVAVQLVPKVNTWIESPYLLSGILPEKIGKLFVHLAKGNQVKKAIEIARYLLAPIYPKEQDPKKKLSFPEFVNSKPKLRFSEYDYEEILKTYIPKLVTIAEEEALKMLGYLLYDAIKFSGHSTQSEEKQDKLSIWEDHSIYWLSLIEEYPQNSGFDRVLQSLAIAVRDAAEQVVKSDQSKIREIVTLLEKWHWRIFHRIALYLIRKFPDADPQLIGEELAHSKYFDDFDYQAYEYIFLAKEHFATLPIETQETILSQIENPNFDWDWVEDAGGKAKYLRRWQLRRLTPLKDSFSENWQQRYDQLVEEFDTIELSDLFYRGIGEVRVGPVSPKTASDLASMSNEELISFLKSWQPTNRDSFQPSSEGLELQLKQSAKQDPERFALIAEHFRELHPRYGCGVLRGLRAVINSQKSKEGELKQISWPSVLQLCNWIVQESQPIREIEANNSNHISNWGEPRRAVADLLGVGLSIEDALEIPFYFRNKVWRILQPLTQDPEPTFEYEKISSMEPSNLSINTNTVRGEAMHTVICYALWVRRHFEKMTDGQQFIERGFDEMPEVREVLDVHLEPNQDPSVAIRSVYGRWFPWLTLLDQNWATENVEKIFPRDEALRHLRRAAWESYITVCPVYDNVFDVLEAEYKYEVEQIDSANAEKRHQNWFKDGLVRHIMTLYWHGTVSLDEPEGLLTRFYAKASDSLCGNAMKFVGRSLEDTKEAIPSEVFNRLQLLWETRLNEANDSTEPTLYTQELTAFSYWFIAKKFDNFWAIEQLKQVLELVGQIELDFLVVEQLATLADAMPELTVKCLSLMIEGDKKGWGIYRWQNEIKTILNSAIEESNETAKKAAIELIHRLGERGNLEFRDLLVNTVQDK